MQYNNNLTKYYINLFSSQSFDFFYFMFEAILVLITSIKKPAIV